MTTKRASTASLQPLSFSPRTIVAFVAIILRREPLGTSSAALSESENSSAQYS